MAGEFREFIMRGNVLDMAVGVIIGAAFGSIVSSLVDDILMPVISLITGGLDFSNWFIALNGESYSTLAAAQEAGAATLNFGSFISAIINFLIVAFCIFMVVKSFNAMNEKLHPTEEAAPTTKKCPFCKSEIAIEATRCPHCTSELPEEVKAEKA
ncbi:MAG: large conductance mechanosensitive channel protein MscL [Lachnospiraceae bacterium]|nr:large conductance mechanosensitive channel protein MscL [Lachnospiraceae bacterium]